MEELLETPRSIDVKRDMELVRRILLAVQAKSSLEPELIIIDGLDDAVVGRHVEMLFDAGFLEGMEHILRLIEEPGEISCVFQFGGFCCAHDSSWWLPQRRRSQQADRVGARWVGGLSRDAPRQRLGAFA